MDKKPNCYECKWKGRVAGSSHISCNHPEIKSAVNNPMAQLMGMFASVKRIPPITIDPDTIKLKIKGNPSGIKKGWFNHPWNFDPIWLEECNGFEAE